MNSSAAASHYAKALFNVVKSDSQLEKRVQTLDGIAALLKDMPDFRAFLTQPFVAFEAKKNVLAQLFSNKDDQGLLDFLSLLIERKRFDLLPEIASHFHKMAYEKLGHLEVQVTTTVPINEEMRKKLAETFEKRYQKKVQVVEKIDPQILGGMILRIGNQVMDGSVKAELTKLEERLLSTPV